MALTALEIDVYKRQDGKFIILGTKKESNTKRSKSLD